VRDKISEISAFLKGEITMASAGSTLKPYNALNGREVMEIILNEMRRQLEADTRFTQHQTYPLISWSWKLAVNVYPNEPNKWEASVGPKTIGDPEASHELAEVQIDLGTSRDVTAPAGQTADSARRDGGIAVPSPRQVKGPGGNRMVVDAPDIKPTEAPRATVTSAEKTNVEKGGKVFARSVTARTPAAPEGVSVPDAERTEHILEKEGSE
jgi:hypothetical protein